MSRQICLFDGDKSYWEIKKHSSIVQMNSIATLQERRMLNSLIWVAKDFLKREPEKRVFTCGIGILKRLTGMKDSDNSKLKKALENLAHSKIEYNILSKDSAHERGIFSILSMVRIKSEGRGKPTNVTFEFPSTVLEVVKNPNMFVRLNLLVLRNLKSKHSIALYELLKDYFNLGKFHCTIKDFRRLMGIKDKQYPIFTMLKKRVLDVSVDEVNEKTDIFVSYDLERYGRKVTHLRFSMSPKKESLPREEAQESIRKKLFAFGLKKAKVEQLLQHHDEQYLWANIAIVEQQVAKGNIKNITAYLLKAFSNDYRQEETEYGKQQESLAQAKAHQIQEEENKLHQLKTEFYQKRDNEYQITLEKMDDAKKEQLKNEFTEKMLNSNVMASIFKSKGINSSIMQQQRKLFIIKRFMAEEYRNFENYNRSLKQRSNIQ